MSFFARKKNRPSQTMLLRPRRSRIFRHRVVRENIQGAGRKLSWWTIGYGFLWSAFFGAAVFVIFFSSLLRVDQRIVVPMKSVPESSVASVVDRVLSGKSFGIVPNDTLLVALLRRQILERELLARFPIFRSVRISFLFPRTISLSSEERETAIVLCSGGPCFFVDEYGVVFDEASTPLDTGDLDTPLVVVDLSAKPISFRDAIFSEDFFTALLPARRRLFDELGVSTSNIAETPSRFSDELRFRTREGWELRASAVVPMEKSFLALRLFFAKTLSDSDRGRLEYIDLRTENRIFYLLKGDEQKDGTQLPNQSESNAKKKEKK